MQSCGLVLTGMGLSTGLTSLVLFHLNLILWAGLAAWVGGSLAFIGSALIIWVLFCRKFVLRA